MYLCLYIRYTRILEYLYGFTVDRKEGRNWPGMCDFFFYSDQSDCNLIEIEPIFIRAGLNKKWLYYFRKSVQLIKLFFKKMGLIKQTNFHLNYFLFKKTVQKIDFKTI